MILPTAKYQVIYCDPAWRYDDKRCREEGGITYETMPLRDICSLPIGEMADETCMLFMWATMPMLEDSFKVMSAWGFEYRTCAFVWVKTVMEMPMSASGFRSGIGNYTNSNAELCLLGRRKGGGSLERINRNVKQIIYEPVMFHSKKPECIYERIEKLYGDVRKVELFHRGIKRQGWDAWGNQSLNETQQLLI